MSTEHRLVEYESNFGEPGYFAVCSCGWKSLNAPTMGEADTLYRFHAASEVNDAATRKQPKAQ